MQYIADLSGWSGSAIRNRLLKAGVKLRSASAEAMPGERRRLFWGQVNKNGPTPESKDFKRHPVGGCWEYNEQTGLFDWTAGPCWIWLGYLSPAGYGLYQVGKKMLAHRFAIEDYNGISLDEWSKAVGFKVQPIHQCDRPSCINPMHFWFGSHALNMADRADKGRANLSEETKRKIGKTNAISQVGLKRSDEAKRKTAETKRRNRALKDS